MAKAYGERGVTFLGIHSGDGETNKQAKEMSPLKLLRDPKGRAAAALKAEVTPEAFILDANFVLLYRGRIDDRYAARLKPKTRISRHDLKTALDEVLAGKRVTEPATTAVGCPIERPNSPVASAPGTPAFYRHVLPILQQHCQTCHRPGDIGPFSLMNYRQARRWATDIKEYTRSRKMPPWKPVAGPAFHGERKLTKQEIATLAAWADGGTPQGDPKDAPPPRVFKDDWQLGKPDLVLTVDKDFQIGATGPDLYRFFVLPTNLKEDIYVSAVEVRPGNRRVVHHAVLFVDGNGRGRQRQQRAQKEEQGTSAQDRGPGYSLAMAFAFLPGFLPQGGLGGWAPGSIPQQLPKGTGYFLPKGADVVMQLHYHRTGRIEKDRTSVGLYFSKAKVNSRMQGMAVPGHFLFIPAGAKSYRIEGSIWVRQDCQVHAVVPHMHLLGRQIKVTMTPPGGAARTLVAIDDWDFNWQEIYLFKEPIRALSGTRFDVEGVYDNSADNPSNPHHPPRTVFVGLETSNEMCVGFLGVTSDGPGRIRYEIQPRIQGLKWAPSWGIPVPGL
jgi:mono/diheme cytochrome c family protein